MTLPRLSSLHAKLLQGGLVVLSIVSSLGDRPILAVRFFGLGVVVAGWYLHQTREIPCGWEGQPPSGTLTGAWAGRLAALIVIIGAISFVWPTLFVSGSRESPRPPLPKAPEAQESYLRSMLAAPESQRISIWC